MVVPRARTEKARIPTQNTQDLPPYIHIFSRRYMTIAIRSAKLYTRSFSLTEGPACG